jgi:hypothetical protein
MPRSTGRLADPCSLSSVPPNRSSFDQRAFPCQDGFSGCICASSSLYNLRAQASKQSEAEEKLQKTRNAASAAQEKSREVARSAAESREKVHHLESVQASLLSERDQLQKQV